MFLHLRDQLQHLSILLASASPRRRELLERIGLKFSIRVSTFAENLCKEDFSLPNEYVEETARRKAFDVYESLSEEELSSTDMIIASDTIVTLEHRTLEKPRDSEDAIEMISFLSGREHQVITAVVLVFPRLFTSRVTSPFTHSFTETTLVRFADLDLNEIKSYVASGEPMDKAGAYGIQGLGGLLIEGIDGCYYNVMGFPIHRFALELTNLLEHELLTSDRFQSENDS